MTVFFYIRLSSSSWKANYKQNGTIEECGERRRS